MWFGLANKLTNNFVLFPYRIWKRSMGVMVLLYAAMTFLVAILYGVLYFYGIFDFILFLMLWVFSTILQGTLIADNLVVLVLSIFH